MEGAALPFPVEPPPPSRPLRTRATSPCNGEEHPRFTCGQDNALIRQCEFGPSTDVHRVAHRRRGGSAQPAELGRLPHSGFRRNVNGPRDTAARKSGETGVSSGSVRLSDRTKQKASGSMRRRTGSRLPNRRFGVGSRRTGPGSTDGAGFALRNAEDQGPTGYSRPPFGFARTAHRPGSAPSGQVQPGLGEGTKSTGSPGRFVPSLNSGGR